MVLEKMGRRSGTQIEASALEKGDVWLKEISLEDSGKKLGKTMSNNLFLSLCNRRCVIVIFGWYRRLQNKRSVKPLLETRIGNYPGVSRRNAKQH